MNVQKIINEITWQVYLQVVLQEDCNSDTNHLWALLKNGRGILSPVFWNSWNSSSAILSKVAAGSFWSPVWAITFSAYSAVECNTQFSLCMKETKLQLMINIIILFIWIKIWRFICNFALTMVFLVGRGGLPNIHNVNGNGEKVRFHLSYSLLIINFWPFLRC